MDWDVVKSVGVPILTGILTSVGTVYTIRARSKVDQAHERVELSAQQNQRDQAQMTLDANMAQNVTARFKALMDGYESRIEDMSEELKETRARIRTLEKEFATHKMICADCITYRQYMKDHPNASTAP